MCTLPYLDYQQRNFCIVSAPLRTWSKINQKYPRFPVHRWAARVVYIFVIIKRFNYYTRSAIQNCDLCWSIGDWGLWLRPCVEMRLKSATIEKRRIVAFHLLEKIVRINTPTRIDFREAVGKIKSFDWLVPGTDVPLFLSQRRLKCGTLRIKIKRRYSQISLGKINFLLK